MKKSEFRRISNGVKITIGLYKFHALKAKKDVAEINKLLPQLSATPNTLTVKELRFISKNSYFIIAKKAGKIIGMATLVPLRQPRGFFGTLQDVVVDQAFRGRGIAGKMLVRISALAKKLKMKRIDLTCSISKGEAHKLYKKKGYADRKTRAMRLSLS